MVAAAVLEPQLMLCATNSFGSCSTLVGVLHHACVFLVQRLMLGFWKVLVKRRPGDVGRQVLERDSWKEDFGMLLEESGSWKEVRRKFLERGSWKVLGKRILEKGSWKEDYGKRILARSYWEEVLGKEPPGGLGKNSREEVLGKMFLGSSWQENLGKGSWKEDLERGSWQEVLGKRFLERSHPAVLGSGSWKEVLGKRILESSWNGVVLGKRILERGFWKVLGMRPWKVLGKSLGRRILEKGSWKEDIGKESPGGLGKRILEGGSRTELRLLAARRCPFVRARGGVPPLPFCNRVLFLARLLASPACQAPLIPRHFDGGVPRSLVVRVWLFPGRRPARPRGWVHRRCPAWVRVPPRNPLLPGIQLGKRCSDLRQLACGAGSRLRLFRTLAWCATISNRA